MQKTRAYAVKKNKPREGAPAGKILVRLGICACLLLTASILKKTGAAEAVSEVYFRITRDVDYVQAFETAGMALSQGDGLAQAVSGLYEDIFITKDTAAEEKRRTKIQTYYEKTQKPYAGLEVPANVDEGYVALALDTGLPAQGKLTDGFGYRVHPVTGETSFHYGMDISGLLGDAVCAFADGEVEAVGESSLDGIFIRLRHEDGTVSYYAHCAEVLVKKGDTVTLGQKIALMGQTGNATGPCLHFELRRGDVYINPIYYLWELV